MKLMGIQQAQRNCDKLRKFEGKTQHTITNKIHNGNTIPHKHIILDAIWQALHDLLNVYTQTECMQSR
jgi:hypothetical protein